MVSPLTSVGAIRERQSAAEEGLSPSSLPSVGSLFPVIFTSSETKEKEIKARARWVREDEDGEMQSPCFRPCLGSSQRKAALSECSDKELDALLGDLHCDIGGERVAGADRAAWGGDSDGLLLFTAIPPLSLTPGTTSVSGISDGF